MWVWIAACAADPTRAKPNPTGSTTSDPTTTTTTTTPAPTTSGPCTSTDPAAVTALAVSAPHALENDRQVDLTLDRPASAALLCTARDDDADRFLLESLASTDAHEFHLQGLRNDTTYDCAAGPSCPPGSGAPAVIATGAPSAGFNPEVHTSGAPPRGWILLGVETEGCLGPGAIALFDAEGRLRWHFPLEYTGMDYEIRHVGGGVLLYGGHTEGPGPVELDSWDGVVWAADLPGDALLHHDVQPLEDGRVLVLEQREVSQGSRTWTGFGLRAFDPATMRVDYDYDSQAAVDQGALAPGPGDAWHANWIWYTDHGQGPKVYVSLCESQQILRLDVASGQVEWVMGAGSDWTLVDAAGQPLSDDQFPQCQHGLEINADGTLLLAYDNGRQRNESRVVEYALDQDAHVATLTREWTDGWFEPILGDADWLPDGTVWVTEAHSECYHADGGRSELVQVDLDSGAELWRMWFADAWMATYRSELLDGCALFANVGQCPALEPRWDALAPAFGL